MPVDPMFILATLAFAWGLSLATYRWFAVHNGWPMGEWQAHRPGLPIAIGLFAMGFALIFALMRGDATTLIVPLFGALCALAWTAMTRIGAQSSLILAPLAVLALVAIWSLAVLERDRDPVRRTNDRSLDRPIGLPIERQVKRPDVGPPERSTTSVPPDRPLILPPLEHTAPTANPGRGNSPDRPPAPPLPTR